MARHRNRHLLLRGSIWWFHLPIPRPLRVHYLGSTGRPQTHIRQSLRTSDLARAIAERDRLEALYRTKFRLKEINAGSPAPSDGIGQRITSYRAALRAANDEAVTVVDEWGNEIAVDTDREILIGLAADDAEEIARRTKKPELAEAFMRRVASSAPTVLECWAEWSLRCEYTEATRAKYRHAYDDLLAFMKAPGGDALVTEVTPQVARSYVRWLNLEAISARRKPLSYGTKKDRLKCLGSLWTHYVIPEGIIPDHAHPWRGHRLTGKPRPTDDPHKNSDSSSEKRAYTEAELFSFINGPEIQAASGDVRRYPKRMLVEWFALGLLLGCRIEEICGRSVGDITEHPSGHGLLFAIRRSKTASGVRTLPVVHPIAVAILKARIESAEGIRRPDSEPLFAGLIPGGKDNRLSWYPQRALGRYRERVGLTGATDFHSTRRSFITRAEGLGLDSLSVMRYVGHKPKGVTFGVYSKGTEDQLLRVAEAITYPPSVEKALRAALGLPEAP